MKRSGVVDQMLSDKTATLDAASHVRNLESIQPSWGGSAYQACAGRRFMLFASWRDCSDCPLS